MGLLFMNAGCVTKALDRAIPVDPMSTPQDGGRAVIMTFFREDPALSGFCIKARQILGLKQSLLKKMESLISQHESRVAAGKEHINFQGPVHRFAIELQMREVGDSSEFVAELEQEIGKYLRRKVQTIDEHHDIKKEMDKLKQDIDEYLNSSDSDSFKRALQITRLEGVKNFILRKIFSDELTSISTTESVTQTV